MRVPPAGECVHLPGRSEDPQLPAQPHRRVPPQYIGCEVSTPTRRDYLLYGALGCALAGTAHAEYTLAIAAHFNPYVALAVPGALDLYVLRALQQRRDVFVAVLAMVAANVTAHLLTAGVLHEHWAITSATGALAPLILWRVYSLKHTRVDASVPGAVDAPEYVPVQLPPLEHGNEYPPAPDRIPDWMDREYPVSAPTPSPGVPLTPDEYIEYERQWPRVAAEVTPPAPELPALPPEYPALTEEQWDELTASDREYLSELNEYIHSTDSHTLAGLREALGIGQARATRLIKYARKEGTW